ncbi:MAG: hypothetical protein SF182_27530 [Deltaproteobacteria bacterium]|nr:hypothetical protein [Deltaproteobacteria bacterium]
MSWWREPPPRATWELRLQRLGVALLLAWRLPALPVYPSQPFPVGVATWIDFSALATPAWAPWLTAAFAIALVLYVLGRAMPLAVGVLLVLWVGRGALASSQGGLDHTTQLLGLVLLAQWIAYLRAALARRQGGLAVAAGDELAVDYSMQTIAAAYVLAAGMKLVISRGGWIAQLPYISSDVLKLHGQLYASLGDAALLARGDTLADLIWSHPLLTQLLIGPTWLLELLAPLALLGRLPALLIGLGLLAMHQGIDWLMLINFRENQALLWIYFVNLPWLASQLVARGRQRSAIGAQPQPSRADA